MTWKVDTEAPVITADNKDSDLECNPTAAAIEAALGSAKVTDQCDDVKVSSRSTGDVIVDGCMRSQTRTFSAVDGCGNTATEVTVTVTWKVDTEAPVNTADNKDSDLECNPTAAAIEAALGSAKVTDQCDDVKVSSKDGDVLVDGCMRSQTRTFSAVDGCGNTATEVTVTVTWKS